MEHTYIKNIIEQQRAQDDYSEQLDLVVRMQEYLPPPTLNQEDRMLVVYTQIHELAILKGFKFPFYDLWSFIVMQCAWREYTSKNEYSFDVTFRNVLNDSAASWKRKADSM